MHDQTMDHTHDSSKRMDLSAIKGRPDRQTAFVEWKRTIGANIVKELESNKTDQRDKKKQIKEISEKCAKIKVDCESLSNQLEEHKNNNTVQANTEEDVIDADYFKMLEDVKALKKDYKSNFASIKEIKSELNTINQNIESCKQKLVVEFDAWWDENMNTLGKEQEEDDEELEIDPEDPDSGAFFKAKKTVKQLHKGKPKAQTKRK